MSLAHNLRASCNFTQHKPSVLPCNKLHQYCHSGILHQCCHANASLIPLHPLPDTTCFMQQGVMTTFSCTNSRLISKWCISVVLYMHSHTDILAVPPETRNGASSKTRPDIVGRQEDTSVGQRRQRPIRCSPQSGASQRRHALEADLQAVLFQWCCTPHCV